jgi:opacity protein-like surface antigen
MKRFVLAAVSAAALSMPAGASAQEQAATTSFQACTTPVVYCAQMYLRAAQNLINNQCTTPVMTCVQGHYNTAWSYADYSVFLAKWAAYTGIDLVDDPPPIKDICYAIWGQNCATALVQ